MKRRRKPTKVRSWQEHEALIEATEKASRLHTLSIRRGHPINRWQIQAECGREALEKLAEKKIANILEPEVATMRAYT